MSQVSPSWCHGQVLGNLLRAVVSGYTCRLKAVEGAGEFGNWRHWNVLSDRLQKLFFCSAELEQEVENLVVIDHAGFRGLYF